MKQDDNSNKILLKHMKTQRQYMESREKLRNIEETQEKLQAAFKIAEMNDKKHIEESSYAKKRFKRAMRRLSIIQRFAQKCDIMMDPIDFDIMKFNAV